MAITRVTSLLSGLSAPSLLRTLISHLRLTMRLLREPGVPLLTKGFPILAAIYAISPVDFIPDFLPLLGQLDDLGVILIVLQVFSKLCPARAVDFHRAALAQGRKYSRLPAADDIIDAEFRREGTIR